MPLPFELPNVAPALAFVTPATRELGRRACAAVEEGIAALVGGTALVAGRPLPASPPRAAGAVLLQLELVALPGTAIVEVEPSLAVALLDRLCGGAGVLEPASSITVMERASVELAALAALAELSRLPEVEGRLAPRLARDAAHPPTGLAVELAVTLSGAVGRARAFVPVSALRALEEEVRARVPESAVEMELSIRGGSAPLGADELDALEPGDVVVLDPPPPGRLVAVLPGGVRLAGCETDGAFTLEEVQMPEFSSEWPIALEVELARVPVTLGELARLEPGGVLPLAIDRRGTVTLKLGDRTVARGQLVDLEGAIGVRIDTLAGAR